MRGLLLGSQSPKCPEILLLSCRLAQDASGNLGEMPKGKDLNRKSIKAGAGKAI